MKRNSKLERIFDAFFQKYILPVKQDGQIRTAQGPFYFLELKNNEWTRLRYADKVATADIYDCESQRYLIYSVLYSYQHCQEAFLQTLNFKLATELRKKLAAEEIPVDRRVVRMDLADFSAIEGLLDAHIEKY